MQKEAPGDGDEATAICSNELLTSQKLWLCICSRPVAATGAPVQTLFHSTQIGSDSSRFWGLQGSLRPWGAETPAASPSPLHHLASTDIRPSLDYSPTNHCQSPLPHAPREGGCSVEMDQSTLQGTDDLLTLSTDEHWSHLLKPSPPEGFGLARFRAVPVSAPAPLLWFSDGTMAAKGAQWEQNNW